MRCAQQAGCVFLLSKEVYCKEHVKLAEGSEKVTGKGMRVDRCIAIHTSVDRPGRKLVRAASPTNLQMRIGKQALFIES